MSPPSTGAAPSPACRTRQPTRRTRTITAALSRPIHASRHVAGCAPSMWRPARSAGRSSGRHRWSPPSPRRQAACCSPAISTTIFSRSTPPTARRSTSSIPADRWAAGCSATPSARNNMWRPPRVWCPASSAAPATRPSWSSRCPNPHARIAASLSAPSRARSHASASWRRGRPRWRTAGTRPAPARCR